MPNLDIEYIAKGPNNVGIGCKLQNIGYIKNNLATGARVK
jgi:hypothetical protein